MALNNAGNYNNSNAGDGRKQTYDQTYYSRTRFKNPADKLSLGFQFTKGMLVVDIARQKDGSDFGYDSVAQIFITHTKAALLLNRIAEFEKYIADGGNDPNVGFCINAGMGENVSVLILHLSPDGKRRVMVGKVDPSGDFIADKTADYEFATNYQYAIKYNNIAEKSVEKEYLNDIEWKEFVTTIEEFSKASSGASAYFVADMTRFDLARVLNKMNPIYEKLGIEIRGGYNGNRNNNNNFFTSMNGGNQGTSEHKSMDNVIDEFPDDDED